jgi:putative oxidoreductase
MNGIASLASRSLHGLDQAGAWFGLLGIRLLLAWEFGVAGLEKLRGEDWFADIQGDFPFPFSALPVSLGWTFATWTELLGAAALATGLGTRFWAVALMVLDLVAWVSMHAGNGYNVCDNGFKLPLIYLVMLLPLVLTGAGKASLDHGIRRALLRR